MTEQVGLEGGGLASSAPGPVGPPEGDSPRGGVPAVDRAAALAEGSPGIPANFVFWVLGAILVLSVGGLVGERVFSSTGLNPTPTTTPTTAARTLPAASPGAPVPAPARSLSAPLASFMGLSAPPVRPAPAFALTDQAGRPTSMPPQPPRVVVLTFFDARCDDICPVLASEIRQADADLGAEAARVEFLTVNTDPSALADSDEVSAESTGLGALANWHMLTGPLATLDAVWKAYGVSISVDTKTGREAHNDVMDFVDPHGVVRYRAVPVADESATGRFSLPAASASRWAQGIALYARKLAAP
jgi:cytochrome oxidase Cu insertion factor (SCO1/SenC/PrrC family)